MHVIVYDCICMGLSVCVWEFRDEILLRGKNIKPEKIRNFQEKWQKKILQEWFREAWKII